jgi:hypothetical protein
VSSEGGRRLTFWQKFALAVVIAFVLLAVLVYVASQTLMAE